MPRSNPSDCCEHRITLGTWERSKLAEVIEQQNSFKRTQLWVDGAVPVGVIAVGAGIGFAGYFIATGLAGWAMGELVGPLWDWVNDWNMDVATHAEPLPRDEAGEPILPEKGIARAWYNFQTFISWAAEEGGVTEKK